MWQVSTLTFSNSSMRTRQASFTGACCNTCGQWSQGGSHAAIGDRANCKDSRFVTLRSPQGCVCGRRGRPAFGGAICTIPRPSFPARSCIGPTRACSVGGPRFNPHCLHSTEGYCCLPAGVSAAGMPTLMQVTSTCRHARNRVSQASRQPCCRAIPLSNVALWEVL